MFKGNIRLASRNLRPQMEGRIRQRNNDKPPVKGRLPGQCQISNKLATIIDWLPKKLERIFPTAYASMAYNMRVLKAELLKNLRAHEY